MLIPTLVLNGLVMGAIYALIGVGLSLIFGVLEIVNFAHGQIYALGALVMAAFIRHFGFGYFPGTLLAALVVGVFGYLLYLSMLQFIRKGEFERGIILTLGIGIVIQNALLYFYGATPQMVDTAYSFRDLAFLGFRVELVKALAVGFAIVSITALHVALTRTRFGKAIRALSQNREAAMVVGMRPAAVAGHAVVIGMALAGLAGAVLAPVFTVHPLMGVPILFKAFAIVIIGGLGHLPGAVVASLIIGVSESLAGGLGSASLQEGVVFLVMIAMLQFKPMGLFGKGVPDMSMAAAQSTMPIQPQMRVVLATGVAVVLVTLPLWSPSTYVTGVATLALFFAVASTGLNVVYGYAGLLSFAQVGFWGLGAYTSALIVTDLNQSLWLAVLVAGVVCTATALLAGFAALRVSRDAFVVISLSFSLLLQLLARSWTSLTRGAMGIPGLPTPLIRIPGAVTLDGSRAGDFYWITLGFAVIVLAITWRLLRSRIGRAFLAVNLDESLARSQGLSARALQLAAFALSALIGGLAGGLYVFKLGIVDPGIFDIYYAQMMLIIVIVGGAGHFWCGIAMSFVFAALPELLRLAPELRMTLFGLLLIATIQFMPQGVGGFLEQRRHRMLRRGKS